MEQIESGRSFQTETAQCLNFQGVRQFCVFIYSWWF